MTDRVSDTAIASTIERLLERAGAEKSICPSEVARELDSKSWRKLMEPVRRVARGMADDGRIRVTQKDLELDSRQEWKGPIRLRLPYSSD